MLNYQRVSKSCNTSSSNSLSQTTKSKTRYSNPFYRRSAVEESESLHFKGPSNYSFLFAEIFGGLPKVRDAQLFVVCWIMFLIILYCTSGFGNLWMLRKQFLEAQADKAELYGRCHKKRSVYPSQGIPHRVAPSGKKLLLQKQWRTQLQHLISTPD